MRRAGFSGHLFAVRAGFADSGPDVYRHHCRDPQQAAVPNATVILRNVATGAERPATTGSEGECVFALVPPGKYTVRAEASGFAPATLTVEATVATSTRADITLSVKEVKQTVAVIPEGEVSVQTDNAELGQAVNQLKITELPSVAPWVGVGWGRDHPGSRMNPCFALFHSNANLLGCWVI